MGDPDRQAAGANEGAFDLSPHQADHLHRISETGRGGFGQSKLSAHGLVADLPPALPRELWVLNEDAGITENLGLFDSLRIKILGGRNLLRGLDATTQGTRADYFE